MVLPADLLRTVWEFAGPWPLQAAVEKAYDFMAENWSEGEKVDFPLCDYDSLLTQHGWALILSVEYRFSLDYANRPTVQLTLRTMVERDDWPGNGYWESTFDFWSLEELVEFLPRLNDILPKGCDLVTNKLYVDIDNNRDDLYIFYPYEWPFPENDIFSTNLFPAILAL